MTTTNFGSLIAFYRRRAKLNQEEFGKLVGLHPTDVSKIERGQRRPPKIEQAQKMLEVLDLSPDKKWNVMRAGEYTASVMDVGQFDPAVYPRVTDTDADARLQGERGFWPVVRLDTLGNIIAANLLYF